MRTRESSLINHLINHNRMVLAFDPSPRLVLGNLDNMSYYQGDVGQIELLLSCMPKQDWKDDGDWLRRDQNIKV